LKPVSLGQLTGGFRRSIVSRWDEPCRCLTTKLSLAWSERPITVRAYEVDGTNDGLAATAATTINLAAWSCLNDPERRRARSVALSRRTDFWRQPWVLPPLPPGVVSEQKNEDQPVGTRTLGSFELVRPDGAVAGFCVQNGKILAHAHLTYIGRLNRRLSKFIL
jgi:hypothetical protein